MSRCTNEMTSHLSTSCFLSKNWHWWDRADRTVWPLTFIGTCHAASNLWHYSVRPRKRCQLWLLPLNMSLPGVGAAATLSAETSLRRLSFISSASREHRLSANFREGDRFSRLSVWAEDASFSESGRRAASLSEGKPPGVFTRQSHDGQSERIVAGWL